jgi:transposase-like protein
MHIQGMKTELLPTPKDLTLSQVMERFNTDDKAREYLEAIRWPNGVTCPHCKNSDQEKFYVIKENKEKHIRAGLRRCVACDKEFTVTVGTIFEDSHIPLRKWLVAWYLICTSKKGVSALQIQRSLGLGSYRTAWMMMHKIRHTLKDPAFNTPMEGTLEADETFLNALPRMKSRKAGEPIRGYRQGSKKTAILALIQRGGSIRTKVVPNISQKNLRLFIGLNADTGSTVNTDEYMAYRPILKAYKRHDRVCHYRKEYARTNPDGTVSHVNNCESFFSLLKRGVYGSFHHVSKEHLHRYCEEFSFRWNHRHVTDGERMIAGLKQIEGKKMVYKQPIKNL